MSQKKLADWNFDSGNACHATIVKTVPTCVAIKFKWTASPSPEDREEFVSSVLPEALRRATEQFEILSTITSELRQLENEGLIEQVGTMSDGEPVWRRTEKPAGPPQAHRNQQCGRVIPFRRIQDHCERGSGVVDDKDADT